jgi:hypothetical protein
MIQKPIEAPKDELQIKFRLHQTRVDYNIIIFWYTLCSFILMFIIIKTELNPSILAF